MADIPLAATAHNATSQAVTEMGLSGQAVQGAIQQSVIPAAESALPDVGQAAASIPVSAPSSALADVAGNATNAISGAVNSAGTAVAGVPMDQAFSWGGYFQAIAVLLFLLALLWGLVWAMRKYGKFNFLPRPGDFPRESLRVEAQVPLGPRKGLVVVRFLKRRILLGVTDQQITFLTEAGQEDEANDMDFQDIMEEARRQKPDGA